MSNLITEKYKTNIKGVISCYDRVILQASLSQWSYAQAMAVWMVHNNILIKDYTKFASTIRNKIVEHISSVAKNNSLEIEYIKSPNKFDKEKHISRIIKDKEIKEGIVHIYSVVEPSTQYRASSDSKIKRMVLKPRQGVCLHYYIYFIDRILGLCYLRIPTWIPLRLQFYFNGHNLLSSKLEQNNIAYKKHDNALLEIEDFQKAQQLSDNIKVESIHKYLDVLTDKYCPYLKETQQYYRWTIMQAEYSTDIIFNRQSDFQLLYQQLIINNIHSVKPENISTFLGKKLSLNYQGEIGNNFNRRILGTRIKHHMGAVSIKMYDKYSIILRIETTVNDVSQFKVFREVNHRDQSLERKYTNMKKNIYSLYDLSKLLKRSNERYLEYISEFDDTSKGSKDLQKISKAVIEHERSFRGFNFFDEFDLKILETLLRGEFNINGFQNKTLRKILKDIKPYSISRILKRLLLHGLIKRVKNTYKYYLTKFGKHIISTALELKELYLIPKLAIE